MAKPKRRKKADVPEREKNPKALPTREPDRVETVERAGLIPFDDGKAMEVANSLVEATMSLKAVKERMAETKDRHKEEMDKVKTALSEVEDECIRLAERHSKGGFEGTVMCERRLYYKEELVVDVNVETGEVEGCRDMEDHEKQLTLVHSDKKPPAKPEKPADEPPPPVA